MYVAPALPPRSPTPAGVFCLSTMQVTEFIDMTSGKGTGSGEQKTVILGESFGAMLGIRLGQLR